MNKQQISELAELRSASDGTSLITMYIPSNYQLAIITKKLISELAEASNIKNKTVRKDVIISLKGALATLRVEGGHHAPQNGLVLVAGVVGQHV